MGYPLRKLMDIMVIFGGIGTSQTWWYFLSADSKLICPKIISMQWLEGEEVFKLVDSQCEMGKTSSWHGEIFIQGSVKPFPSDGGGGGGHIAPLVEINTIHLGTINRPLQNYSLISFTVDPSLYIFPIWNEYVGLYFNLVK